MSCGQKGKVPMKIRDVPFTVADRGQVPVTAHAGETGKAIWRTLETGNVRVRVVEYSADDWCDRGHILLVTRLCEKLRSCLRMRARGGVKALFIAGFGPIGRDTAQGRKLYGDALGIRFKGDSDGYLYTDALQGAKHFALWPVSQAALSCFGKDS